jgi:5-methylcytosine-specific restriction endonuclease McrA
MNVTPIGKKQCKKCGNCLEITDFYLNKISADGLRPECKPCFKEYSKNYRLLNAEKERKRAKKYRDDNPEIVKNMFKKYRKENPDKRFIWNLKRRANKLGNNVSPYTLKEVFDAYGLDCHICKKPIDFSAPRQPGKTGWEFGLHIDHLIALVNGGADSLENVRPSHGKCNLNKGSK